MAKLHFERRLTTCPTDKHHQHQRRHASTNRAPQGATASVRVVVSGQTRAIAGTDCIAEVVKELQWTVA